MARPLVARLNRQAARELARGDPQKAVGGLSVDSAFRSFARKKTSSRVRPFYSLASKTASRFSLIICATSSIEVCWLNSRTSAVLATFSAPTCTAI